MRIWLISAYGPIPGEGWRDYRYTIMGEVLAAAGHDVVWWTPNFSHHFKRFRSQGWEDRQLGTGFRLRLVPAAAYSGNISLGRLRYELLFAWNTYHRALGEARPDCIVVTDPPQVVGRSAIVLARRFGCRLVFDVMDLWPELFELALPAPLRALAPLLFLPLRILRSRNYARADAVISLCETYKDTVLRQVPRLREVPSATVFNGIDVPGFRLAMQAAIQSASVPPKGPDDVWAVYAGTLGENYDVPALMECAMLLQERCSGLRILVAGEGPLAPALAAFVRDRGLRNLTFLGRLSPDELARLYRRCDIGICAYGRLSNVAMPDKAYDYMAAGLPLVSSLAGELARYIRERGIGLPYRAGDPDSLACALEEIAGNTALRSALAARSRECGMEFDRRTQYSKVVDLVRELVPVHP